VRYESYLVAVEKQVIAELSPGDRLVDIGSGDGRRLSRIMNAVSGISCVAIEPSVGMSEICRQTVKGEVYTAPVEEIDKLDIDQFDVVTSLWNVFGHISSDARLGALENIADKLRSGGKLILDFNNRHNAASYGRLRVAWRRILDVMYFREERGDATYEWHINGKVYQGHGHLFTPREIESLFAKTGFSILRRLTINYKDGKISQSKYDGQLFYVLEKL